jgi:subtilisin family serine protease
MALIKIKFGKGDLVLTKSTKMVGIKKSKTLTRGLMASELDPEIKKIESPHMGGFELVSVNLAKGEKINTKLDTMRELDEVEVGTHVYCPVGSTKPLIATGSLYITFESNVSEKKQVDILAKYFLELKERRSDDKVVAVVTPQAMNPIKTAIKIQRLKAVKWAEPDMDTALDHYAFAAPVSRLWNQMWHLSNNGRVPDNSSVSMKAGADVKILDAWRLLDGYGNPNITVAVIDNGIDLSHPDLKDKVVKPWDLWSGSSKLQAGDPNFTHGTPCASVAIAPQNGGMCGAAPNARFMPLSGTGFSIESTEAMFNYCIRNGADIISCSWGTVDQSFSLGSDKVAAIAKAAREGRGGRGIVICYAAGNEGMDFVNVYGRHPDVICVGASTSDDTYADYSNRGREVTVCAPSNGSWPVLAARAFWDPGIAGEVGAAKWYYGDGVDRGSRYQHFGGTSSATPLVAGICALILSANPNLTAREVKQILCQTADKIGSPSEYVNGQSVKYGFGRVNAARAVQEAFNRAGKAPVVKPTTTTPTTTTPTSTPSSTSTSLPSSPPAGNGLFKFMSSTKVASKGFAVQAGSFNQWVNVKSTAATIETKFKQPTYVHIVGSGTSTTIYRVLVGQFSTLAEANKLLGVMKANGVAGFVKDLSTLM